MTDHPLAGLADLLLALHPDIARVALALADLDVPDGWTAEMTRSGAPKVERDDGVAVAFLDEGDGWAPVRITFPPQTGRTPRSIWDARHADLGDAVRHAIALIEETAT